MMLISGTSPAFSSIPATMLGVFFRPVQLMSMKQRWAPSWGNVQYESFAGSKKHRQSGTGDQETIRLFIRATMPSLILILLLKGSVYIRHVFMSYGHPPSPEQSRERDGLQHRRRNLEQIALQRAIQSPYTARARSEPVTSERPATRWRNA